MPLYLYDVAVASTFPCILCIQLFPHLADLLLCTVVLIPISILLNEAYLSASPITENEMNWFSSITLSFNPTVISIPSLCMIRTGLHHQARPHIFPLLLHVWLGKIRLPPMLCPSPTKYLSVNAHFCMPDTKRKVSNLSYQQHWISKLLIEFSHAHPGLNSFQL